MPFLRRSNGRYYDFETAYGYGGPVFSVCSVEWVRESLGAMTDHFRSAGYLCGFVRFHPLLGNAGLCKGEMSVLYDRKTISLDLKPSVEDIWSGQISSKNRNMIRKAEKNGLEYRTEYDYASLGEFKELYNSTMLRLGADGFYFFQDGYYDDFVRRIADKGFLGVVRDKGKTVGAALFMLCGAYGHYHLAGSDRSCSCPGINNFLLWNTAKEMKEKGVEFFHLGGGTGSDPEDSLYRFKRSFSRHENDFNIGKWIFDEDAYNAVCAKWEKENPELVPVYGNRLLKYRYLKGQC
jgi:hypothetical protein